MATPCRPHSPAGWCWPTKATNVTPNAAAAGIHSHHPCRPPVVTGRRLPVRTANPSSTITPVATLWALSSNIGKQRRPHQLPRIGFISLQHQDQVS